MIKRPMRSLAALTLLFAVGVSGCDTTPVTPADDVSASHSEYSWISLVTTTTTSTETSVTQVVGRQGGQIQVGKHTLYIPHRAVTENTEFTFTVAGGSNIQVHLSARRVSDGATVSTFPQALTLRLSYAAAEVSDPSRLKNVFLVDGTAGGRKEVLSSAVSTYMKTVSSPVVHFSPYAMAID